ncbi:helix-turn-helix domain-containing protein [Nocardia sp. NBC_00565]|uniref:helix-turn-helix domain-containing protein n=1 Tax=Nocardia sp. NBC_00565 TaxID=2975993 RepID=UPI003FA538AD
MVVRHTSFRFCLDPTVEQEMTLSRHVGAARFAFNQCLHTVKTALTARRTDRSVPVPWSGFDLINDFNRWKKSEQAGRVFIVDTTRSCRPGCTPPPPTASEFRRQRLGRG